MVDPHYADRHEAREERKERGPQVRQCACQAGVPRTWRHADLEDEERNRDGEDAVAECLDSCCFVCRRGAGHVYLDSLLLVLMPLRRRSEPEEISAARQSSLTEPEGAPFAEGATSPTPRPRSVDRGRTVRRVVSEPEEVTTS